MLYLAAMVSRTEQYNSPVTQMNVQTYKVKSSKNGSPTVEMNLQTYVTKSGKNCSSNAKMNFQEPSSQMF